MRQNDYAAQTLPEIRLLLTNLHHEIENQGGSEGDLFRVAEETIRWLLDEYLRRGEFIVEADE